MEIEDCSGRLTPSVTHAATTVRNVFEAKFRPKPEIDLFEDLM